LNIERYRNIDEYPTIVFFPEAWFQF